MKFFSRLLASTKNTAVGIDIGSSAIKVVQLTQKGQTAQVDTYGSLALGPYGGKEIGQAVQLPDDKLAEALGDILREAETTTKRAGITIPFESSLMSVVEMPTDDDEQLQEMVPIEARKYIPVPMGEVSLDWMRIPSENKSVRPGEKAEETEVQSDVLLVAIHNQVIEKYQGLVKAKELDAQFLEIEIFSTVRSIIDDTSEAVLIFDMGAANTKLYLVKHGVVHGSHTINRGSQDVTHAIARAFSVSFAEAEKIKRGRGIIDAEATEQMKEVVRSSLAHIFSDTEQVLENFSTKYGDDVKRIFMVGGGATLNGLQELANKRINAEILLGNAFGKVQTPAFLEDVLRETGPEFTVAAGAALRVLEESE